ncbi:hypothetical protein LCGC14_2831860, partial [marine sediment metagenome]
MNKTKHTPGPWTDIPCSDGTTFIASPEFRQIAVIGCDGSKTTQLNGYVPNNEGKDNAWRIVACVNALAGIDDPVEFVQQGKAVPELL